MACTAISIVNIIYIQVSRFIYKHVGERGKPPPGEWVRACALCPCSVIRELLRCTDNMRLGGRSATIQVPRGQRSSLDIYSYTTGRGTRVNHRCATHSTPALGVSGLARREARGDQNRAAATASFFICTKIIWGANEGCFFGNIIFLFVYK